MPTAAVELEALVRKHYPFSFLIFLLRIGARDADVRKRFLAFLDVLPSLRSNEEIARYFDMYVGPVFGRLPWVARIAAQKYIPDNLKGAMLRWFIKTQLAPHFIIESERQLQRFAHQYKREGASVVVDLLGEQVVSLREAEAYFDSYLALIRHPPISASEEPLHVALKFSSLYPYFSPENYDESVRVAGERFAALLREAQKNNVFLVVDAEHYQVCRMSEEIFLNTICQPEFASVENVGIALQAYRKDATKSACKFVEAAKTRGSSFLIRLIKGAYWDTELIVAQQNGWPFPLLERKQETDYNFNKLCAYLLWHCEEISLACGTHNPASIAFAVRQAHATALCVQGAVEFQVLYGLGEPVRRALCELGLPVRVYMPYGNIQKGMAYLARRILENTTNEGFLLRLLE